MYSTSLRLLLTATLFVAHALTAFADEPNSSLANLWDAHRPGVAQLIGYGNNQSVGATGFLTRIQDREVLITNAHVIAGVGTMSAKFDNLGPIDCRLIDANLEYDLAALELVDANGQPTLMPSRVLTLFPNELNDPPVGSPIAIIGHPERLPTSIHSGSISADPLTLAVLANSQMRPVPPYPDTRIYQLNVTSTQGFSGAPVFNFDGQVVAVQERGWQHGLTDINFSIPHTYIRKLQLGGKSTAFPGGSAPYDPTNQNTVVGLINLAAIAENPQDRQLAAIACRQFGVFPQVPGVAEFIFQQMVGQGNKERFQRLIPYNQLVEVLRRNRIVHLENPAFGFSFLVPESYQLTEEIVRREPPVLRITVTDPDQSIVPPYNRLTIWAKRIDPPTLETIDGTMREVSGSFVSNVLQLQIHPPPQQGIPLPQVNMQQPPPWTIPNFFQTDNHVLRIHGGWSDDQFIFHPVLPLARFHVAYDSFWPARNTHMVHYAIAGSTAVAVEFEYQTFSPRPGMTKDLVERQFIAESIALYLPDGVAP